MKKRKSPVLLFTILAICGSAVIFLNLPHTAGPDEHAPHDSITGATRETESKEELARKIESGHAVTPAGKFKHKDDRPSITINTRKGEKPKPSESTDTGSLAFDRAPGK